MPVYRFSRAKTAFAASTDFVTIVAAAGKPLDIMFAELVSAEGSIGFTQILLSRSSGGTTPGGAITPKGEAGAGAAGFAVYTTWSAQPTIGDEQFRFGIQHLGGKHAYQAKPGDIITVPASGMLSLRLASGEAGTPQCIVNFTVNELGL